VPFELFHVASGGEEHAEQVALLPGALGGRMLHRANGTGVLGADVEHDLTGADRTGRKQGTVDDEVGTLFHEHAVLPAQRLALAAVGEHDRSSGPLRRDRAPLGRNREPGSALAAQLAPLDDADERPRWQLHGVEL